MKSLTITSITFDKSLKSKIIRAFGKKKTAGGLIVESESERPVLTKQGEELRLSEFGGIVKGSEVYLKSDITSLIEFYEDSGLWDSENG
ncbi:hypothetical protein JXA34_01440 [Patescibacteria group bacterium]|nr:hypothetical protein [Patescibacteria group bacterium]